MNLSLNDLEIVKSLERISDLAQNLTEYYGMIFEAGEQLPELVKPEIKAIYQALLRNYEQALLVFTKRKSADFLKLKDYEDELDKLEAKLRNLHLQRLAHEYAKANVFTSILADVLSTIERIGDHTFNIGSDTFAIVKEQQAYKKNVKRLTVDLKVDD